VLIKATAAREAGYSAFYVFDRERSLLALAPIDRKPA
jgi:hypothetical protein